MSDWQLEWCAVNDIIDRLTDFVAILYHLTNFWPLERATHSIVLLRGRPYEHSTTTGYHPPSPHSNLSTYSHLYISNWFSDSLNHTFISIPRDFYKVHIHLPSAPLESFTTFPWSSKTCCPLRFCPCLYLLTEEHQRT